MSTIHKKVSVDGHKYHVELKHNPSALNPKGVSLTVTCDGKNVFSIRDIHPGDRTYKEVIEDIVKATHEKLISDLKREEEINNLLKEVDRWDGVVKI